MSEDKRLQVLMGLLGRRGNDLMRESLSESCLAQAVEGGNGASK